VRAFALNAWSKWRGGVTLPTQLCLGKVLGSSKENKTMEVGHGETASCLSSKIVKFLILYDLLKFIKIYVDTPVS
jgi:hypothetical protein